MSHKRFQIDCSHDGRTKQEMKDDVDINRIIARYRSTGQMVGQFRNPGSAQVGDFSTATDFKQSMNLVNREKARFATLSATQRAYFENDVQKFLSFMADPENLETAIRLKLVDITPAGVERRKKFEADQAVKAQAAEDALLDKLEARRVAKASLTPETGKS